MLQFLLLSLTLGVSNKPTVPLADSCAAARAIAVVEPAADAGAYRMIEVLYDGLGYGLKKDTVVAVDLKGMVYDKERRYILFLERTEKGKGYQAVKQMRTEDAKETRQKIVELLQKSGKVK